ncbi:hypothetical protein FBEOM_11485 [Fusarium beomiforme]|uniref:Small s protein n=1 Tax=Fusarium beomiforme TaxID=44412 RepID=A0A9P5A9J7_9HYPO|nr:hypothetical protein FBEOM_11485 [Fusarium beomiforme]
MSGAEAALLGVGILCNAMQIITFAKDSLHVYRNIREGRAPDPKLDSYLKNAKSSFDEMNQTASQMGPLSHVQQQIVDVGIKVYDCVDELQQKFAELHVDEASKRGLRGKVAAFRKSAATLWRGKELEDAEKSLQRHEALLHSLLLDRICSQSQATEITSLQSFQHLDGALQGIILQLVDGSTKVSDLITDCSSNICDRIAEEHSATRTAIEDHVTSAENTIRLNICHSIAQIRQELLQIEKDKAFEKQQEQLLSSLRFPEMNSRKNQISTNYPGTFDWIFNRHLSLQSDHSFASGSDISDSDSQLSQESDMEGCNCLEQTNGANQQVSDCFPRWLGSDSHLFWISSKPASGKSFLMMFLAFNQQTAKYLNRWHSNVRILTHFFWKPGHSLERNVKGMALSLLFQVMSGRPSLGRTLYEYQPSTKHKITHSDWILEELADSLIWALKASHEPFCIFLDGLDEAKELEHLPWPAWTNAHVIHKLSELKNVKLCASSREERAFCSFFEGSSQLRIHYLNHCDITRFVCKRLETGGLNCGDQGILIHEIVYDSEGVFLWAALVVDSLNRAIRQGYTSIDILRERLEQTPSDLTTLYTDMWSRIGDDGQLRTVKETASRYFNLLITARKMDEFQGSHILDRQLFSCIMNSLPVMATAVEYQLMESIISTGREIALEELLARCSKTEKELRVVCRGLLETTSGFHNEMYCVYKGDERLKDYNVMRIDFTHRSAFDFLVDTEPGRECLQACGLSESDQASILFASYLVTARFLSVRDRYGLDYRSRRIEYTTNKEALTLNTYLKSALIILSKTGPFAEQAQRETLFQIVEKWQLSGLFYGHEDWTPAPCYKSSLSNLKLEFIETLIDTTFWYGGSSDFVSHARRLLSNYSVPILADAIPVILRALSGEHRFYNDIRALHELLKHILCRFKGIAPRKTQQQGTISSAIRALHCWYITRCLEYSLESGGFDVNDEFVDTELFSQLRATLVLETDWQYPILFEFIGSRHHHLELFNYPSTIFLPAHYALVVGNFASAYRLLNKLKIGHLSSNVDVEAPHSARSQFETIILADINHFTVDYYIPDIRLYGPIQYQLYSGLQAGTRIEEQQPWPHLLHCSSSELEPVDRSKVFDYVLGELKDRGVDFFIINGIMLPKDWDESGDD